jgi:hypothetical protein
MRVTLLFPLLLVLLVETPVRAGQPCPDLSGRWPSGCWQSDATGHKGPLRATFRPQEDGDYRVTFRGRFWGVIPFLYSITLHVTGQQGDRVMLSGSSNLPLFGTFTFTGEASATEFNATYESRNDRGVFHLSRD